MNKKRFLSLLLCISMLIGVLVSCADDNGDDRDKPTYDDSSRENVSDAIPEDYSLNGQTVGIFYARHIESQVIGDREVEDIVYTRIYERNEKVKWRLNCELNFIPGGSASSGNWKDFCQDLNLAVGTLDNSFWIVQTTNNTVIQEKLFDRFHNMNDSMYVDIDREWWQKDAILECSVDGYYYRFLYGDISLGMMGDNGAIYYNKDHYGTYLEPGNPDGLYDLVLEGRWTFDKFATIVNESFIDYGGENNIYGFTLTRYAPPTYYFPVSCGIEYYVRDESGYPTVTINNDKAKEFAIDLYDLLYNNLGTQILYYPNKVDQEKGQPMFTDGKYIFSLSNLITMLDPAMREMDYDFGVLPYPKWDEAQEEYITMNSNQTVLVGCTKNVPIDTVNEEASAVIEALCSEAYRSVTLAFYEDALQRAYSRDDTTARMIDIICGQDPEIKSRVTKNFLYEYSKSIGGIGVIFSTIMEKGEIGTPNFGSTYGTIGDCRQQIEELYNKWMEDSIG